MMYNDTWIIQNYENYKTLADCYKAYCRECETVTYEQFKYHCRCRLKIKCKRKLYTDEELDWLRRWYHVYGYGKVSDEFYKTFGRRITADALKHQARKLGTKATVESNKLHHRESNRRQVPVGSIVDDGRGYLKIKTSATRGNYNFEFLHRHEYEKVHGKLSKNDVVIFLDGDRTNCKIENLRAISRAQHMMLKTNKLQSECPQITDCGITWTELKILLKEQHKEV